MPYNVKSTYEISSARHREETKVVDPMMEERSVDIADL